MLKQYLYILAISAVPVIEQRGAIPLGILLYKLDPVLVTLVSYAGSLIPMFFVIYCFTPIFKWLSTKKILKWFYDFVDNKVRKGKEKVERYEVIGLTIFVAIPLPMTGVWTGSAVAAFMQMNKKKAFISVSIGAAISAIVITVICYVAPKLLGY
ncbi:MAG TPA: small multi-drug export protein [Clostridia bacterium]|jgi:uncharacterized membrane protein|nr:small multi-drug export protein [Clostridiaceae bacterium]HOF26546.1 small multi-drug export protein [Clostridia bacterium]HOM34506.1 small multi-drug export protein [Clostridia bacterium]HOR90060.1 small multi-drug export protein [Clostridia bacterium]HOT70323.1 small multi-drug export protein [Clostridia bacterium]